MKVLLINGSPHPAGTTFTALKRVADTLENEGISTEIFQVGTKPVAGCLGCGYCGRSGYGKCVNSDDTVNQALDKIKECDGIVVGSPVHYAAASGMITSFLDRLFYAGKADLMFKPGAAVVCCRRGGATAALDQLTKYFTISDMPVVSSQYWSMVHGNNPEQAEQDLEGMQTMEYIGKNMSWLLKCIDCGKNNGIVHPQLEPKIYTNFIR